MNKTYLDSFQLNVLYNQTKIMKSLGYLTAHLIENLEEDRAAEKKLLKECNTDLVDRLIKTVEYMKDNIETK